MSRTVIFLLAFSLGCGPKRPAVQAEEPGDVQPSPSLAEDDPGETTSEAVEAPEALNALGGDGLGFVVASSANGRMVVLRRWEPGEFPEFGQHGYPQIWPDLVLLDYEDETEFILDEFIEIGPQRRWLLLQDGESVVLVDSDDGSHTELDEADPASDGNACLAPRSAAFGFGESPRISWPSTDRVLQVWDLEIDERWEVRSDGRIWRAWPDAESQGAYFLRVSADSEGWPYQRTSCACTWCSRFAMIESVYGWTGPEFELVHSGETGEFEVDGLPDNSWAWQGSRVDGCSLTPAETGGSLDTGPWSWVCLD